MDSDDDLCVSFGYLKEWGLSESTIKDFEGKFYRETLFLFFG